MIPHQEIRRRVLLMLDNEPGFLAACTMANLIGCTVHDVVNVGCVLESEGVVKRGVADGNKIAFRIIFK